MFEFFEEFARQNPKEKEKPKVSEKDLLQGNDNTVPDSKKDEPKSIPSLEDIKEMVRVEVEEYYKNREEENND